MALLCPEESRNGKNQSDILDKEAVIHMIAEGKNDKDIAEHYNCSRRTVIRFRQKHGISVERGGLRDNTGRRKELGPENLAEIMAYIKQGKSNSEIAGIYECTARTVLNYRQQHRIDEGIEKEINDLVESDPALIFGPTVASLTIKTGYAPKLVKKNLDKSGHGLRIAYNSYVDLKALQRQDSYVLSYERIDRCTHEPYFEEEEEKAGAAAGDGNYTRGRGGARRSAHNSQAYSSIYG